jgi:hypothetical protein
MKSWTISSRQQIWMFALLSGYADTERLPGRLSRLRGSFFKASFNFLLFEQELLPVHQTEKKSGEVFPPGKRWKGFPAIRFVHRSGLAQLLWNVWTRSLSLRRSVSLPGNRMNTDKQMSKAFIVPVHKSAEPEHQGMTMLMPPRISPNLYPSFG